MLSLRPLGRTGMMVSPLGLGTVKFGRAVGVKYPDGYSIPDDVAAADLLRLAQRLGVTLLDTAPAYGEAEERLGRILGACGGRDRWTIVTKAGEEFDAATGESRFDFSPPAIKASVERSLKRLRTDRVEVALLHSDGRDEWILQESGALDALGRLRRQGKARRIGISTKTPDGAMLAVEGGACDVVMLTLNATEQGELPAIRAATSRGVGVLIKKAFASGHSVASRPEGGAPESPRAALARCFAEPGVTSVIVGTIRAEHLIENTAAAEELTR